MPVIRTSPMSRTIQTKTLRDDSLRSGRRKSESCGRIVSAVKSSMNIVTYKIRKPKYTTVDMPAADMPAADMPR